MESDMGEQEPSETNTSETNIRDITFVKVPLIYKPNYNCTNILLIDNSVYDYQTIVESVNSNTMAIVYSYLSTKEDLSNAFSNFTTISRLAFAFCSNSNNCPVMFLDNQPLFSFENSIVDNNSENLLFLIEIIQKYNIKNVDYLACNTLNYPQWQNYYNILKNIIVKDSENQDTTIIVGASNDTTGNIKYGGDWILENTSEDIETIYFTQNINYYEYLLDNAIWLVSNSNNETAGIVTMYDSVTTKNIMFVSSGMGNWAFGCNFPPTTGTNNWNNGSEFGVTASPFVYGMTVFTSAFTSTATNKQFVIAALSTGAIGYFYNFVLNQNTGTITGGRSGSISTNATWLATGATMSNTTNVALYNNRLFYSLPNGNIGSAIITDATVPTIGSNNVAYINTTLLSSSTTLYPIGLTTDTNGYLYAALGNITSAATTGVIKVINVTSTPTLAYTISLSAANITTWGNPYALIWNSDKLYIGTTIGVATSATAGTIVLCNTLSGIGSTVTSTLAAYKTGTKCIGGMAITGSSLYTCSLKSSGTTVSQYDIVVTITKGFYNNITDIVGNFSSITQLTSFPTFNGISNFSTKYRIKNAGVDVDLALLYALNSTPITASYNTSMYTYVNNTIYDLSSLFAPIPPVVTVTSGQINITGSPIMSGYTNANITTSSYNSANVPSSGNNGTLYTFTYTPLITTTAISKTGTITLTSGTANCYVICIGAGGLGGYGTNGSCGCGGSCVMARFSLVVGVSYTITAIGGSCALSRTGNTTAGYSQISNSNSTLLIKAYGGIAATNATRTSISSQSASCVGTSEFTLYSGGSTNYLGAGSNGFILSGGTSDLLTNITSANGGTNGFSGGGGYPSGTAGGGGGQNNIGGTFGGVAGGAGGVSIGYGAGGGGGSTSFNKGGLNSAGVVFLYLSPSI